MCDVRNMHADSENWNKKSLEVRDDCICYDLILFSFNSLKIQKLTEKAVCASAVCTKFVVFFVQVNTNSNNLTANTNMHPIANANTSY